MGSVANRQPTLKGQSEIFSFLCHLHSLLPIILFVKNIRLIEVELEVYDLWRSLKSMILSEAHSTEVQVTGHRQARWPPGVWMICDLHSKPSLCCPFRGLVLEFLTPNFSAGLGTSSSSSFPQWHFWFTLSPQSRTERPAPMPMSSL